MSSDYSYDRDPLVRFVGIDFAAIPMMRPICRDLDLWKVLRKTSDGFRIVGDLATVCQNGQKKTELQRKTNSRQSECFPKSKEMGHYCNSHAIDTNTFANASFAGIGVSTGFGKHEEIQIDVPFYKEKKVDPKTCQEMLRGWIPDPMNEELGWKSGEVELWVVQRVVEVRSLTIMGVSKREGQAKASVTIPSGTIPAPPFKIDAGWSASPYGGLKLDSGSRSQVLPIAFSGYVYRFKCSVAQLSWRFTSDNSPDHEDSSPSSEFFRCFRSLCILLHLHCLLPRP